MDLFYIQITIKSYIEVLCYLHRLRIPMPYDNLFIRPESIENFTVPTPTYPSFGDYIRDTLFPNGPRNYEGENMAAEIIHDLIYKDLFYKGFPTRADYELHDRLINDKTFSSSYDELKRLEKICELIRIYPNYYEFYKQIEDIHKKLLRQNGFIIYIQYLQNEAIKNHELQKIEDKRINKMNSKYFKTPIEQELEGRLNEIRMRNQIKILCNDIIAMLIDKVITYNKYQRKKLCKSYMTK